MTAPADMLQPGVVLVGCDRGYHGHGVYFFEVQADPWTAGGNLRVRELATTRVTTLNHWQQHDVAVAPVLGSYVDNRTRAARRRPAEPSIFNVDEHRMIIADADHIYVAGRTYTVSTYTQ